MIGSWLIVHGRAPNLHELAGPAFGETLVDQELDCLALLGGG
jgi:hypothetical protein